MELSLPSTTSGSNVSQLASVQQPLQGYECKEPSHMIVDNVDSKGSEQKQAKVPANVKDLDEKFFCEKTKVRPDGNWMLARTERFNIAELLSLRNWLADFFRERLFRIEKGQPALNAIVNCSVCQPFGKDFEERIERVLTILRLKKTDSQTATVFFDVTSLVPKNGSQSSLSGSGRFILHCKQKEMPANALQDFHPKTAKETALIQSIQQVSRPIQYMILSFLELGYVIRLPQFYMLHGMPLKGLPQINEESSNSLKRMFGRVRSAQERSRPLHFSSHLQMMRGYVTELTFTKEGFSLNELDQLALFFPHIRKLSFDGGIFRGEQLRADDIARHLQGFKELESLDLTRSDVTGATFNLLPPSLKTLKCGSCRNLLDAGLPNLAHTNLQNLEISETPVTGSTFHLLPRTLKRLRCAGCEKITDATLAKLAQFQLECLDIVRTQVQGVCFDLFAPTLKRLDCYSCKNLNDDAVKKLSGLQLKVLNLGETKVTGMTLQTLAKTLKFLGLWKCPNLKEEAIRNLKNFPLEGLSVDETKIAGTFLSELPKSIKYFTCSKCCFSDATIGKMNLPELIFLDLSKTAIQGTTLKSLSRTLKVIGCESCPNLTEEARYDLAFMEVELLTDASIVQKRTEKYFSPSSREAFFEKDSNCMCSRVFKA